MKTATLRGKAAVRFVDVGADKKNWTAMIPIDDGLLSERAMIQSIRKNNALMSRVVDVGENGGIYVGGWRCVGKWEFVTEGS